MKIFRNIYVKGYKKFPYQKLTGRNTMLYRGKIFYDINSVPSEYDSKLDFYFDCDCEFGEWKNLQRIF